MARSRTLNVLRFALTPLVVWGLFLLKANIYFRLYPAVMVALALGVFAVSLRRTPIVETIARRTGETLDAGAAAYCRKVTQLWTFFLALHLAVTVSTLFASREIWAFYNGFLAYVLMGALLVGEWLVRRKVRRV